MKARIGLVIAVVLGVGCRGTSASLQTEQSPPVPAPWVRICVLQDLSGSIKSTRTPVLTPDHLQALAEIVSSIGGEVGFGLIREASDLPLLRSNWDPAPPEPPMPSNPLLRARWRKQQDQWVQITKERQKRVLEFRQGVEQRLQQKLAVRTDVCGALQRCFLMLTEPSGKRRTRDLILVVSDGLHNVRRSQCPEPLESIEMLVVNGQGLLGILRQYKPRAFESPEAAVRYIRETVGGNRP